MKYILVINSGSSSIKYQLLNMPSEALVASGLVERIGHAASVLHYKKGSQKIEKELHIANHREGLEAVAGMLLDAEHGVIQNVDLVEAVAHRVVHGGSRFSDTTEVNDEVKKAIQKLFSLAPLHNPPNYEGIEVAEAIFPKARQVAVFDTAFHQTLPEHVYRYAIPNTFYEDQQIRVYGFHGISHKYVSERANEFLRRDKSKLITIHLGNGCSMTAVKNGKSVDHSLGFGPVNGLIMGTRSGDIDQSVIFYLIDKLGYTAHEVSELLHKKSGMLGLTGFSDLRDIESRAEAGDETCKLALYMNAYRIRKYIGAFAAAMNGVDALVFTAGIGENSSLLRDLVCRDLDYLGVTIEKYKNDIRSSEIRVISTENSPVKVLVVPTNEELEIARQAYKLIVN